MHFITSGPHTSASPVWTRVWQRYNNIQALHGKSESRLFQWGRPEFSHSASSTWRNMKECHMLRSWVNGTEMHSSHTAKILVLLGANVCGDTLTNFSLLYLLCFLIYFNIILFSILTTPIYYPRLTISLNCQNCQNQRKMDNSYTNDSLTKQKTFNNSSLSSIILNCML